MVYKLVWVSVQRRDEKEVACLASPLFFIVVELFVALAWNTSFIFGISMVIEDLRVASMSFRGLFNHSSCRVTLDCSDVCWFFCPTFPTHIRAELFVLKFSSQCLIPN